jgi:uncharacterized protein (DUF2235 family)
MLPLVVVQNLLWACVTFSVLLYGSQKTKYELRRRTIVVLFDGTAEDRLAINKPATNIGRFADQVRKRRDSSVVIMYNRGVATSEEHGLPFSKIPGLILGKGISQIVRDVYLAVVDNYRPGDSLYLLGYSRGAAAAWELACLLDRLGVPRSSTAARKLARNAFKKLRKKVRGRWTAADLEFEKDRVPVPIKFLGLFDCVVATGALIHINRLPASVQAAYHAVAIDERRRHFAPTLLPPGALEVWFTGAHSNIGGGTTIGTTLGDIALQWMLENAARHGLPLEPLTANLAVAEREIDQAWNYFIVRLAGEMRPRTLPLGAIVHPSVLRMISNTTYRPRNLPETFRVLEGTGRKFRYRWCKAGDPRKGQYEVECGDQRMLRLPPIGMDRNVLPPPREEPTAEKGEDDAKGTNPSAPLPKSTATAPTRSKKGLSAR